MLDIEIREADESDAAQIANLHRRVIREVCSQFYPEKRLVKWIRNISIHKTKEDIKQDHFLVEVKDKDSVIGFVHFDDSGRIFQIYVDPTFTGKHIGSSLLEEAEKILLERGIKQVSIISSLRSASFFKYKGYNSHKRFPFGDAKIPMIEMKKSLD